MKNILFFICSLFLSISTNAQIITTVAGTDSEGYNGNNIFATTAELLHPVGIAVDGLGNFYIADTYNNLIRKVDLAGIITIFAGNPSAPAGYNGDGIPATTAEIFHPTGIISDHSGNIFFCDAFNSRIRKIDTAGIITTVAGNGDTVYNGDNILADSAAIYTPYGIAFDNIGNMYISDYNHRIRKVDTSGIITTIAGIGVAGYTGDNNLATNAEIIGPYGIVVDAIGNIYFADYNANVVRKIDTSGIITTFAGEGTGSSIGDNGPADSAKLNGPTGLAIDNNNIYIADTYHSRVRKVNAVTSIITTVAGNGTAGFSGDNGLATLAELYGPNGVCFDSSGNMYIADFNNNRIRYVTSALNIMQIYNSIESLNIYPNPSQGFFTVNVTSNIDEQIQLTITNITGQKIKEITVFTNTPSIITLNEPNGIYFLSAISSQGILNKIINVIK